MRLDEYQEKVGQFASYPPGVVNGNEVRLVYPVLGLAEEIAELNEKVRGGHDAYGIIKELGDVCWFIQEICTCIGIRMSEVVPKLAGEHAIDVLGGQVCGILAKSVRDNDGIIPISQIETVKSKLGGILGNVVDLTGRYNVSLEDVLKTNYSKLSSRMHRGVIHGSGDDR